MTQPCTQIDDAKVVIDRFFGVRTGVCIPDVKPGQVAVATCDRRTYAEQGYGYIRLLWVLQLGDRAVVSVHPAALAETARLAWSATPEDVLGDEFGARVAALLRRRLSVRPAKWSSSGIKFYHPGGAQPALHDGLVRCITPADAARWPGDRRFMSAAEHPSAARGEGFGVFAASGLVGDIMTHSPPVAGMAHLVAEDGIEVAEEHRRRGFGRALLAHWTCEMQRRGRACLHGTSLTNVASIGLARSVGYVEYARNGGVTYVLPER